MTPRFQRIREWIKRKREGGSKPEHILHALHKQTGGKKEHLRKIFPELESGPNWKMIGLIVGLVVILGGLGVFLFMNVTEPLAGKARAGADLGLGDFDQPRNCVVDDVGIVFANGLVTSFKLFPSTSTNFNTLENHWYESRRTVEGEDVHIFGDYNGDGLTDFITSPNYYLFTNNGEGFDDFVSVASLRDDFRVELQEREVTQFLTGDVNGDGNDDIVAEVIEENQFYTIYVALSDGDGGFSQPMIYPRIVLTSDQWTLAGVGDVDGDGDDDIVIGERNVIRYLGDSEYMLRWHVVRSNPADFPEGLTVRTPVRESWDVVGGTLGDFFRLGDFNNDGNLDLLIGEVQTENAVSWSVALSNGEDAFGDLELWASHIGKGFSQFFVGNFDDIGGDDLLYTSPHAEPQLYHAELSWFVAYSDDDHFREPRRWLDSPEYYVGSFGGQYGRYVVGNFNGNDCPASTWQPSVAPRSGERCDFDPHDGISSLNGKYVWSYRFPDLENHLYGQAGVPQFHGCCPQEGQCSREGQCFDEGVHGQNICSDGNWYSCTADEEKYVREVNGAFQMCEDGQWQDCPDNYCHRASNRNQFKINQCMDINEPGYYVMFDDIPEHAFREACVVINAADVTLDCRGYSITAYEGEGRTGNLMGIDIQSSHDVSVRNCEISGFSRSGIHVVGEGHTFTNNYIHGVNNAVWVDTGAPDPNRGRNDPQVGYHSFSNNVFGKKGGRNRENHVRDSVYETWVGDGSVVYHGYVPDHGESDPISVHSSFVNNRFEAAFISSEVMEGDTLNSIGVSNLDLKESARDLTLVGNRLCHYRASPLDDYRETAITGLTCSGSSGILGYDNQLGDLGADCGFLSEQGTVCCLDDQCQHDGQCYDSGRSGALLCDLSLNPLGYDNLVYDSRDYPEGTAIETSSGQYYANGNEWGRCENSPNTCQFPQPRAPAAADSCPERTGLLGYEVCDIVDNDCDARGDEVEDWPCGEVAVVDVGTDCVAAFDYYLCADEIITDQSVSINIYTGDGLQDGRVQNSEYVADVYMDTQQEVVAVDALSDYRFSLNQYQGSGAVIVVKKATFNQCVEGECVLTPSVVGVVLEEGNNGDLRVSSTPAWEDLELVYDWRLNGESITALNMPFTRFVRHDASNRLQGRMDYSKNPRDVITSRAQFMAHGDLDENGAYLFPMPDSDFEVASDRDLSPVDKFTYAADVYPIGWGHNVRRGVRRGFARIMDKENIILFLHNTGFRRYNDQSLLLMLKIGGEKFYANTPAGSMRLNRWRHVAATYDTDVGPKIYINGRDQPLKYLVKRDGQWLELDSFPQEPVDNHNGFPLHIGNNEAGNRAFQGRINHVQIFNRAISREFTNALRQGRYHTLPEEEVAEGDEWSVVITPVAEEVDGPSVESNVLDFSVPGGLGEGCETNDNCAGELVCVLNVCRESGGDGDTCDESLDCAGELVCENDVCVEAQLQCDEGVPVHTENRPDDGQSWDKCCDANQCARGNFCWNPGIVNAPILCAENDLWLCGDNENDRLQKRVEGVRYLCFSNNWLNCNELPCGQFAEGEICDDNNDCEAGLVCRQGEGDLQCLPPVGEGGACNGEGDCVDGLVCEDNVCREDGGIGDPCQNQDDCHEGLQCVEGQCREGGGVCENNGVCGGELVCRPLNGELRCQSVGGDGDGCDENDDCEGELECRNGFCREQLGEGDVCQNDEECAEGLVCRPEDGELFCSLPGGDGDGCNGNNDCQDGLVCREGLCREHGEGCGVDDADCDGVDDGDDIHAACQNTPPGKAVYPAGNDNAGCQLGDIDANGAVDGDDLYDFLGLFNARDDIASPLTSPLQLSDDNVERIHGEDLYEFLGLFATRD